MAHGALDRTLYGTMFSPPPSVPCFASPLSGTAERFALPAVTSGESLAERAACYARTVLVAVWSGALDIAVLAVCIHWFDFAPLAARAIAIALSGYVAFLGNRSFAFRAQTGSVPEQARRFALAELLALPLNLLAFRVCGYYAVSVGPELLGLVANGLVFVAFLYPMRRWFVFKAALAR